MIDKAQILQHFHKASISYDLVAQIQLECAKMLINQLGNTLPNFQPNTILDLGTGTGYVPELLMQKLPLSFYSLNDIAEGMLEQVEQKFKSKDQFAFILGDMENLNFAPHDLIISNFALQWTNDFDSTIAKLYDKSKVLAFSYLLDGTFEEWKKLFETKSLPVPTYPYPLKATLEKSLLSFEPVKHSFATKNFKMTFSNSLSFMKHLKQLGASTPNHLVSLCDLKKHIINNDQEITVTYKVFFAILRRT